MLSIQGHVMVETIQTNASISRCDRFIGNHQHCIQPIASQRVCILSIIGIHTESGLVAPDTYCIVCDGTLCIVEVDLFIQVKGDGAVNVIIAQKPIFTVHRVGNGTVGAVRVHIIVILHIRVL